MATGNVEFYDCNVGRLRVMTQGLQVNVINNIMERVLGV